MPAEQDEMAVATCGKRFAPPATFSRPSIHTPETGNDPSDGIDGMDGMDRIDGMGSGPGGAVGEFVATQGAAGPVLVDRLGEFGADELGAGHGESF